MKSICLFASYFPGSDLPYYVRVYLQELKKQFSEVVLLCSQPDLSQSAQQFLHEKSISWNAYENKGFDFGLWYSGFQKIDLSTYEQVALVNDSCILFKSLDEVIRWSSFSKADIKGITRSEAIYPHLQSYFLLLNKKAVDLASLYFREHKQLSTITDVIHTYEVGLSKYWQDHGLTIAAFADNNGYIGEFSPYYYCVEYHLSKGVPMIKKKILFGSYRKDELNTLARMNFNIDRDHYFELLSADKDLVIDLDRLKKQKGEMSNSEIFSFNVRRHLIALVRPFYKLLRPGKS